MLVQGWQEVICEKHHFINLAVVNYGQHINRISTINLLVDRGSNIRLLDMVLLEKCLQSPMVFHYGQHTSLVQEQQAGIPGLNYRSMDVRRGR